jgi:DNA-binding NarL/FixJ family response regulator
MSLPLPGKTLPAVLLAEPDVLLRRAVVTVASDMGLANVHPAHDIHAAVPLMEAHAFDAIVIALDQGGEAIELLTLLRCGQYLSAPATPVAVISAASAAGHAERLASLGAHDIARASCTVRRVLDTIGTLLSATAPDPVGLQKK